MNAERAEQALRARKFLELHQGPKTLLLPNAWDVASARVFEEAGFTQRGLPVGLQIVGRRFADTTVLKAAAAFESARPWEGRRPTLS